MNIKDIIIKINNRSELYEDGWNTVNEIDSIYIDKIIEKCSYTKNMIEAKKRNSDLIKKNPTLYSHIKSFFSVFLLLNLLFSSIALFFSVNQFNLINLLFFFLLLSLPLTVVAIGISEGLQDSKSKKNKTLILKNSEQYINSCYKDFSNNITINLIDEIDLIVEPELQQEKENIKQYLITRAYNLDNDIFSDNKHDLLKKTIINKIFIENNKPLDNKILKETCITDTTKQNKISDTNNVLKELKVKYNEKTPVI